MKIAVLAFGLALCFFQSANAGYNDITGFQNIRWALGLNKVSIPRSAKPVKVAIVDKAFYGIEKEIGRTLPADTVYSEGPLPPPEDFTSDHGVRMAQIISGLVTEEMAAPQRLKLYLYNAYGFSNFKAAISDLIAKKVDLVLYSEVWEFGGNLDGQGFINEQVSRATNAGILWVNAVGNFGLTTYNGNVVTGGEGWIRLPDGGDRLRIDCLAPKGEKCGLKLTLSWNDFKNDPDEGTDQDLDFEVLNKNGESIGAGELKQSNDRHEQRPGYSKYSRETILTQVKSGTYWVRVKDMSGNFTSRSVFRITADGEHLIMPSTKRFESVLVPADNPAVLTVGAVDSDRTGRSIRLSKPEIFAASAVRLANGDEFRGSSNSAAFVAAGAAWLKLAGLEVNKTAMLKRARAYSWESNGLSLGQLRFGPTQQGCFKESDWKKAPTYIRRLMARGARVVNTTSGWRLMTAYDPIQMDRTLTRRLPDDIVFATEEGLEVAPRNAKLPEGAIEIFQRPVEAGLCAAPNPIAGRLFSL